MDIQISQLQCIRCSHRWVPRKREIRVCPGCHSPYWDRSRTGESRPSDSFHQVLDRIVRKIVEIADPEKVILFGSRATGHTRPGSDVDLLVVTRKGESRRQMAVDLYRVLRGTGLGKDIVVVRPEEFEKYRDMVGTIIYPAAHEGKVLYERAA